MVIAANELSRNGDELNLRGISFKNYRKNPVVCVDLMDGVGHLVLVVAAEHPISPTHSALPPFIVLMPPGTAEVLLPSPPQSTPSIRQGC